MADKKKKDSKAAKKALLKKLLGVDVSDDTIDTSKLSDKQKKKLNLTLKY